ncbi:hypothetical protein OS493_007620 [Desmophyllum pertusum]|uniref:Uncharacterized protein n=1 Tax=Desmophyllum pertusum TaxID=174260 RepID=A0A9W9YSY3_9CNID|nr:hypothetical protein OS493_007620 [Desmophyllum pertusum]
MAQCAIQPDTSICNQQPHGGMECKINNSQIFATIGQQLSVAAEPGTSVYNEQSQATECKFNDGKRFTAIELQELAIDDESGAVYNEQHSQDSECELNNGQSFATVEQQRPVAAEANPNSINRLTMEQLQLVPEGGFFPDVVDSDSDDDYSDDSDDGHEPDAATID